MKKLAAVLLSLSGFTTGVFAQGLVSFFPTASTLSSVNLIPPPYGSDIQTTSGAPGSWYYGLLISSGPTGPFTFSGVYATNLSVAGYFGSPAGRQVPNWLPGTSMSYEVAIWSASLGVTWNPGWVQANNTPAQPGSPVWGGTSEPFFGLSSIATGISGGAGAPATPPLPLFGGTSGIQSGVTALPVSYVPEPSSLALAGLGAAALLLFHRRK